MTISKARRAPKAGTIPDFHPVPRHQNRHDGWTEERQRGFIAALADTGSVKAAAHRVNMTPEGAYHLRRHPDLDSFRKAWESVADTSRHWRDHFHAPGALLFRLW